MCEVVENYAKQVAEEVAQEQAEEHARNLFANGATLELVKKCITNLSTEKLQVIYESVKGTA